MIDRNAHGPPAEGDERPVRGEGAGAGALPRAESRAVPQAAAQAASSTAWSGAVLFVALTTERDDDDGSKVRESGGASTKDTQLLVLDARPRSHNDLLPRVVRKVARADARPALAGACVIAPRRAGVARFLESEDESDARVFEHDADGTKLGPTVLIGIDELASWLVPGGFGTDLEQLLTQRGGASAELGRAGLDAAGPIELERATRALVESVQGLGEPELACLGRAWEVTAARLAIDAPDAARRLVLLGRLVDRPSDWAGAGESVFGAPLGDDEKLADGRIAAARAGFGDLDMALAEALPGWGRVRSGDDPAPVTPHHDGVAPLDDGDLARVHDALANLLPQLGGGRVARGRPLSSRAAQVDVGDRVARSWGRREHLLLHAPTGTGKTLAYLVPGLLFAVRQGVRVGFSTYTKALQRQAFDRDMPLALELLSRIGIDPLPRVSVLKGRANYVCWRALLSLAPGPADSAARHLAWCHLLAFALTSDDGDLDRLPRNGLEAFADVAGVEHEWELLRRSLGARSGCCNRPGDRQRCAADAARRRAERSHGVVTNHAFALARPEFFRHLVFDECEHLHDQAHGAFSRAVSLERAKRTLDDLAGARGRGVLEALRRALSGSLAFGAAQTELERAMAARTRARAAIERLARGARRFGAWRRERAEQRDRNDEHSLLREYVESGLDRGDEHVHDLVASHGELCRSLHELGTALAALSEGLFEIPVARRERVRFELDGARSDIDELYEAVAPWLPQRDGTPAYDSGTFYDLDERPGGDIALETRVLLPHEHLGRFHYPKLAGAVFLSATTLLRGGFEGSRRYLGLERAALPAADEEREPERVETHAARESFDYSRVCVLAPTDVPDYRGDKHGWLAHGARLVAHLAERTGGRMLALYTNQEDLNAVARAIGPHLARRGVEVLAQNQGVSAERLVDRFRTHGSAVLLGVDSFWFGADFPGEALEYLVIAKLPYGVPDRYHHAQCAAMGRGEQRSTIYLPRALARFRQGFGRLMRRVDDRGCVFVLDRRFTEPQHRVFQQELPLVQIALGTRSEGSAAQDGARLVRGDTDRCLVEAFEHMGLAQRVHHNALWAAFEQTQLG